MTKKNLSVKDALFYIKKELKQYYPEREISGLISIIFEYLLNYTKTDIHLNYDTKISEYTFLKIEDIVRQLKKYNPIQYITGKTSFFDLELFVEEGVFIPRPETEELVSWILNETPCNSLTILDVGTGSGCIAIALARNLPKANIHAFDLSEEAINIAKRNAKHNNVNVSFFKSDIFNPGLPGSVKYDIIVSNPPYILENEKKMMHKNVLDFEPQEALFVPETDPLKYYRAIVNQSKTIIRDGGKLYLEINEKQGPNICKLLEENSYNFIETKKDINGKTRMARAYYNKKP